MLDTEPLYKRAWQTAAQEYGYQIADQFYDTLIGRPTEECEEQLVATFGNGFPIHKFRTLWPRLWDRDCEASGIQQKPGLAEFLAFASSRHIPVAIATSSDADYTATSLRRARLDPRQFDAIITRDQVANGKPAPDTYLEAARRLEAPPSRCVAFEDSDAGIIAAKRAGLVPVLIPDLKEPSPEARVAAYRVLESLRQAPALVDALLNPE